MSVVRRQTLRGSLVVSRKPGLDLSRRWVVHLRRHCGHADCAEHPELRDACMAAVDRVEALCGIHARADVRLGTRLDEQDLRDRECRICVRCASRAAADAAYRRFVGMNKHGRRFVQFFELERS